MLEDVSHNKHSFSALYTTGKCYQIEQQAMIMAVSRASRASDRNLRFVPEVAYAELGMIDIPQSMLSHVVWSANTVPPVRFAGIPARMLTESWGFSLLRSKQ